MYVELTETQIRLNTRTLQYVIDKLIDDKQIDLAKQLLEISDKLVEQLKKVN